MAGNGWNVWTWLKWRDMAGMAENNWKWLEMAGMAGNGWKLLEMACN